MEQVAETKNESLRTEKIGKLLVKFSIPSIISWVLNALYSLVDQIFIGQGVGYLGNGATNVIFPMTQFAVAIGLMIGDGTAAYMNLMQGRGEKDKAEKGMAAGIAGLAVSGILLSVLFNIFLSPLCKLFGATAPIMPYAMDYGRIISIGTVFNVFSWGAMSIVRADKSPNVALVSMLSGFVINMIGDPVTIFSWGWGVKGAAWATILGQMVSCIICGVYFAHTKTVPLSGKSFQHSARYLPKVSKLGLSSFFTQIMIVLVISVQNNTLVHYGAMSKYGAEIPMTALGVTMKVFCILQYAITGLTSGAQPVLSYNYGAGENGRVKSALIRLLIVAVLIMGLATIWFQVAPMSIVKIFGESNALYNDFSCKCLKIYLSLVVLDAIQMVASSFLQSIGKPGYASFLITFRQLIINIPSMIILSKIYGVIGGLYAGWVSSLLVGILASIVLVYQWHQLSKGDSIALKKNNN